MCGPCVSWLRRRGEAAIEDGRGRPGKDRDGDQGMNDVVMRIIIVRIIFIDSYIAVIDSHCSALIIA